MIFFFWRGRGWLVAVLTFVCSLLMELGTESLTGDETYYQTAAWPLFLALAIAGGASLVLGRTWNREAPAAVAPVVPVLILAYVAALGAVLGCRKGSGSDAGTDAGPDSGISAPDPPAAPAAPVAPDPSCPAGWGAVAPYAGAGVTTCDPWPVSGVESCADDEAHFPGEPGCTRIGTACPAGEWPEGLPAGPTVLFVRAGGAPGGDGTQGTPFGSVGEALAVAVAPSIIALGTGAFDEEVVLPDGITL